MDSALRTRHSALNPVVSSSLVAPQSSAPGPLMQPHHHPSSIIHHPARSSLPTPDSAFKSPVVNGLSSVTLNSQLSKGPSHLPPRRYPRPGRGRTTALLYCFRPQILRRRGPGAYSDEWGGMGVPIAGHWSTRTVCGGLSVASETVARGSQGGEALSADSCSKPALLHEQLCFTGGKTVPTPCNWRGHRKRLF